MKTHEKNGHAEAKTNPKTRAKAGTKSKQPLPRPATCPPQPNASLSGANGGIPPQPKKTDQGESPDVAGIIQTLQERQRERSVIMKSRIMQSNRLIHVIAGTLGYHSGMKDEKERTKKFAEAEAIIEGVIAGARDHKYKQVIIATSAAVKNFIGVQRGIEAQMVKCVKQLPIVNWVLDKKRRGFGLLGLAIVIGECGDLLNYANPGKLWRRMGCAPYTFQGQTHMGATWRAGKEGKLHTEQWKEFGYSPRRRSIAYLIGEGIVKQNGGQNGGMKKDVGDDVCEIDGAAVDIETGTDDSSGETGAQAVGPYRARYDKVKAEAAEKHPEWVACECRGTGKKGSKKCSGCNGKGKKTLRCHRHAMLLATKMLLRDLWVEWHKLAGVWVPDEWSKVSARYGE